MSASNLDLLTNVGLMSLLALSAYILLLAGVVSFGQQAFFGIGAYVAGVITVIADWPLALGLATGAFIGGAACSFVGFVTLRLRGFEFAVATLALAEIIRILLQTWSWRVQRDGEWVGPDGINGFGGLRAVADAGTTPANFCVFVWIIVAIVLAAFAVAERTWFGRHLRSVGEDRVLAAAEGIDVLRQRLAATGLAGALAGLGGGLYAHHVTFVEPGVFDVMLGIHALAYGLIGGLGTAFGPLLGTALDIGLLAALRGVSEYRMIIFGGLVAILLVLRPRGLLDERAVARAIRLLGRSHAGN